MELKDEYLRQCNTRPIEHEGDYLVEDIIFCGKCNTPKQKIVNLLGKEMKVSCLCNCESERRQKAEQEDAIRSRSEKIEKLRMWCMPNSEMHKWTFEADDGNNEELTRICKNYVKHFDKFQNDGTGLLLFGNVGCGKTYAACEIANYLIDNGKAVPLRRFSELVLKVQSNFEYQEEILAGLNRSPLIVIDDFGAERETDYMYELIHLVINGRYENGLPMIITTNLSADELMHPSDLRKERIYSRILKSCSPYEVKGIDRRIQSLKESFSETSKLLLE